MDLLDHLTYDEDSPYYQNDPVPLIDLENHIIHGLTAEKQDSMQTYLCPTPCSL